MTTENLNPSPHELGCLLMAVGSVMHATGACAPKIMSGEYDTQLIDRMTSYGLQANMARKLVRADLRDIVTKTWGV